MELNSVILFGSRATEKHTVWSDYDVCVVSSDFKDMKPWERAEKVLSCWKGTRALEPVCYTKDELENSNFTVVNEIKNSGKIIYDDGTLKKILYKNKEF